MNNVIIKLKQLLLFFKNHLHLKHINISEIIFLFKKKPFYNYLIMFFFWKNF